MRGEDRRSGELFSYVDIEARIRPDHPLRTIRSLVNETLEALSGDFAELYTDRLGRPSIPPERLLRAMLLQAFYTVRSERQLMERLEFDLLFRWFVGLSADEPAWDASSFSKNRERLLGGDIAGKFLGAVISHPWVKRLLSTQHFSVDGTLIEAWAGMKSFQPKDQDPNGPGASGSDDFHGQKRSNATHSSTTDPYARLYRKGRGKPAQLCYMGHVLMENRNGLAVAAQVTPANGFAEREVALTMVNAAGCSRRQHLGPTRPTTPGAFGKPWRIGDLLRIQLCAMSMAGVVKRLSRPLAMTRRREHVSALKRSLAGSRWWHVCPRPNSEAAAVLHRASISRSPLTTSFACPIF